MVFLRFSSRLRGLDVLAVEDSHRNGGKNAKVLMRYLAALASWRWKAPTATAGRTRRCSCGTWRPWRPGGGKLQPQRREEREGAHAVLGGLGVLAVESSNRNGAKNAKVLMRYLAALASWRWKAPTATARRTRRCSFGPSRPWRLGGGRLSPQRREAREGVQAVLGNLGVLAVTSSCQTRVRYSPFTIRLIPSLIRGTFQLIRKPSLRPESLR